MKILNSKKHLALLRSVFVLFMCLSFSTLLLAETVEQLKDEDRVLASAYELHLTSVEAPFSKATVSLNHDDAWVFFDNIKPSDVIANHLTHIKVNGESFVPRSNGRVARYAHGTVLMPHASSFKPLTVYTETNFGGTSTSFSLHTYYNSLGANDNAIKSFKLKRGYMATFANEADGTGYSRVFIADDKDLEFDVMPDGLRGRVSFIRVFKHEWVTKKGWCGGSYEGDLSGSTWVYDWQAFSGSTSNLEFVPMRAKLNWSPWSAINGMQDVSHSLGLNEPDHPEQHEDDNGGNAVTVEQAIAQWPEMLKSGLRVGAPATTDFGWLYSFMERCEELNYRVDYVAVHAYWGSSAQSYYNTLKYLHERTGRPIWITEWNYGANWTSEWWPDDPSEYTDDNASHAYNHIKEIVEMFDTASFIERYSIYNWVEDARAIVLNGSLTQAGEFYANNASVLAFNKKKEVIPGWNYVDPSLSYRYLSLSNSIKVSWEDDNDEMAVGYRLEKKVDDGAYETVYESEDVYVRSYTDPLDAHLSGRITYRLALKTIYGTYRYSNENSYFQSGGEDSVQVANLGISGEDWQTCLFSKVYEEKPAVLLGVPSFDNTTALTTRVNSISTKSFKLTFNPWNYLNSPDMSAYTDIAVLAMPVGRYDFGGLKGEVAVLEGLNKEWVSVTFDQVYDTIPVVFATQISNLNSFPTSLTLREVSKTGFEVCLRIEEAEASATLYDEKINFLVIEPGQGSIEGKRMTVAHTLEGEGLKSSIMAVNYTRDYSEPVYFANLQTSADDFATTLRYIENGEGSIKLFKQRELSGGLASIKEDKVAWMVMDIADGQTVNAIRAPKAEAVDVYPNPVSDRLYLDTIEPQLVTIYTLSGNRVMNAMCDGSIDVSILAPGMYLCRIGEGALSKIIKE